MAEPNYATREQIARATDVKATAAVNDVIDRLNAAASRQVEREYHRRFYPLTEARTYTLESSGSGTTGFWLEADLVTVTAVTVDGTAVDLADVTPTPADLGPPFSGLDLVSPGGADVVVLGAWGYSADEADAGALAAAVTTSAETTCTVTNASLVGVGDLIRVDTERMVVTGRGLATTTATLSSGVDALASATLIPVSSGALVHAGETITIDAERMLVIDVAGNNAIVRRAVDGSTLAAHLGAAVVYAPRLLTVARGSAGTTAATHLTAAALTRNVPPGTITELVIAETIAAMQQELAGWSRTSGSGESQVGVTPQGIEQLRTKAEVYRRWRIGRAI